MTRATRLRPCSAGVAEQTASKSASARGRPDWSPASLLTPKRNPCTEPSAGRAVEGPWVAYDQEPFAPPSQNDQ